MGTLTVELRNLASGGIGTFLTTTQLTGGGTARLTVPPNMVAPGNVIRLWMHYDAPAFPTWMYDWGYTPQARIQYSAVVKQILKPVDQQYVALSCDTDGAYAATYRYGFNGQQKDDEVAGKGNHNTALFWEYDTRLGRRWNLDPVDQVEISNYAVNANNPVLLSDPDGDCPNCVTGAIGGIVGGLLGGGIEIATQLYQNGSVNNWSAVAGASTQGAVTGAVAGFTGGASLLVTTSTSVAANVVGGVANRTIQGKETTVSDVIIDGAVGAGGAVLGKMGGNFVEKSANNASKATKGKLGEMVTKAKYGARGYVDEGKAVVPTGNLTNTGQVQVAKYDFDFRNILNGKRLTVESKFNRSGFTPNQRAALPNVTTPGGVIVDRTTGKQLGDAAATAVTGASGTITNHSTNKK